MSQTDLIYRQPNTLRINDVNLHSLFVSDATCGALDVTGDVSLGGAAANWVVSDSLTVHGSSSLKGGLTSSSDALFESKVDIIGATVISDTLDVDGLATFNNDLEITQMLLVEGDSSLEGALTVGGISTFSDDVIVKGDIDVGGNFTVSGTTTFINTENMTVEDNIITINRDPSDGGGGSLPAGWLSGIEVLRLSDEPFRFVFEESSLFGIEGLFKIGKANDPATLQAVATRDELPEPNGIMYWNDPVHRVDASTNLYHDSGQLGIGTSNPQDSLHVAGTTRLTSDVTLTGLSAGSDTATFITASGKLGRASDVTLSDLNHLSNVTSDLQGQIDNLDNDYLLLNGGNSMASDLDLAGNSLIGGDDVEFGVLDTHNYSKLVKNAEVVTSTDPTTLYTLSLTLDNGDNITSFHDFKVFCRGEPVEGSFVNIVFQYNVGTNAYRDSSGNVTSDSVFYEEVKELGTETSFGTVEDFKLNTFTTITGSDSLDVIIEGEQPVNEPLRWTVTGMEMVAHGTTF